MTMPLILAASWNDGVVVFSGDTRRHELAGKAVGALAADRRGGVFAIVDRHALCHRSGDGAWSAVATSEPSLACLTVVGDTLYVGTDDARVLRVAKTREIEPLGAFDDVAGRETWYAGTALVDGRRVGPPLGVRSISATADGGALLANVHVGGIPRSTDGGATWQATIDVDSDVHEVRAHPTNASVVIAAAAAGFCVSRDGGVTWTVERRGLHAPYCSAVAFTENHALVAASTDHFASRGAVYRRPLEGDFPLEPLPHLPRWLDGIVDTGCIATRGSTLAVADKAGNLYVSTDSGHSWLRRDAGLRTPSGVLVL